MNVPSYAVQQDADALTNRAQEQATPALLLDAKLLMVKLLLFKLHSEAR